MADEFELPEKKCVVFWPVGTGDCTTLVLKPGEAVMQIDLRHLVKADDQDESEWPVIDHLVQVLPQRNGKPYLAVFALTHPDKDHIQGFAELLEKVLIGELWHTPKIFRDRDDEPMCEDAIAFRAEADRRRKATLANPSGVASGDRLRIIGHDDVLNEEKYRSLPSSCKSVPGHVVSLIDGRELQSDFEAFIHAPFKDDQAASKNNTSLSLNVVIKSGENRAHFFFFGDREYPTIKRIFETTEQAGNEYYLRWDATLTSHHCSKCVMYWKDDGSVSATLKQDIVDFFEKYARPGAYMVSSSHSDFTDGDGDNPPHKKARQRYEEIVDAGHFICTHEHPTENAAEPIVFTVDEDGLKFEGTGARLTNALRGLVNSARGNDQPPSVQIGFGKRNK